MGKRSKTGALGAAAVLAVMLVLASAIACIAKPTTLPILPSPTTAHTLRDETAALHSDRLVKRTQRDREILAWIDALNGYECTGACVGNPRYRRLDVNGFYSYGCLQFQLLTWTRYARRYGVALAGDQEIYNCARQRDMALLMIKNDPSAWKNWYTSVITRGLGKPPGSI